MVCLVVCISVLLSSNFVETIYHHFQITNTFPKMYLTDVTSQHVNKSLFYCCYYSVERHEKNVKRKLHHHHQKLKITIKNKGAIQKLKDWVSLRIWVLWTRVSDKHQPGTDKGSPRFSSETEDIDTLTDLKEPAGPSRPAGTIRPQRIITSKRNQLVVHHVSRHHQQPGTDGCAPAAFGEMSHSSFG